MKNSSRITQVAAMRPEADESKRLELGTTPSAHLSDEFLLKQFVETGDRSFFEQLLRRYQYEIYNYLRKYLGDENLAEDAFQLTFVNVFRKGQQFDRSRKFRPWLYGIATNQAIDLQRSLMRRRHQSLDAPLSTSKAREVIKAEHVADHRVTGWDDLDREELCQKMRAAIDEVGEPGRSALDLVYLQGMPYRDAAKTLNVPVGTVKSRVHAAIRKLAAVWHRTTGTNSDL